MSELEGSSRRPQDLTPEESGGGGRMFTQEEVNRIVSERLSRERERAAQQPDQGRERALQARESRMDCREYLAGRGYPPALLEALDTSDPERFRRTVDKLMEPGALFALRGADTARPPSTVPGEPDLAAAFRPPE